MIMCHRIRLATFLTAALCTAGAVQAQTERSGGGEAQRFMQQYQQVSAEKTALQAQVTQMKKDLDAAQAELATVKKDRDALKARAGNAAAAAAEQARLTASNETVEKNLEQYKQRMTELVARFRETAGNLRDTETDRSKLRQDLQTRNQAYDQCAENNLKLYEINGEILDHYEHVGLFTKVSAGEPFTKITRSRLENLVDEYRERALLLRVKKQGEGAAAPGPQGQNTKTPVAPTQSAPGRNP
jgi:Skp family chaperone for outer membrane proteins